MARSPEPPVTQIVSLGVTAVDELAADVIRCSRCGQAVASAVFVTVVDGDRDVQILADLGAVFDVDERGRVLRRAHDCR